MSDADTPSTDAETLWIVEVTAPLPSPRVQIVVAEASARLKLPPEKLTALLDNRIGPVTKPLPRASAERVAEVLDVAGVDVQLRPSAPPATSTPTAEPNTKTPETPPPTPDTAVPTTREVTNPQEEVPAPTSASDEEEARDTAGEPSSLDAPAAQTGAANPSATATWKPPLLPTRDDKVPTRNEAAPVTSATPEGAAQLQPEVEASPEVARQATIVPADSSGQGSSEAQDIPEDVVSQPETPVTDPVASASERQDDAVAPHPEAVDESSRSDEASFTYPSTASQSAPASAATPPFDPDEPAEPLEAMPPQEEQAAAEDAVPIAEPASPDEAAGPAVGSSMAEGSPPLFANSNLDAFEAPSPASATTHERVVEASGDSQPSAASVAKPDPWARLAQDDDTDDLGQWSAPAKPASAPPAPAPETTSEPDLDASARAQVPESLPAFRPPSEAKAPTSKAPTSKSRSIPPSAPTSTSPAVEASPHPMFSTEPADDGDDEAYDENADAFFGGGMRDPFKEAEERERAIRRGILLTALVIATGVLIFLQRGLS